MKISSTIGFERTHNPTLAIDDEDEFVEQALAKLGPQPPNFEAIVELNKGALLTDGVEVLPLAPRQVEQKRADGALLVDVRTDQQFDDAHIAGAICNPMLTRRLRLEARVARRPRARDRVRRPRRRRRPARRAARGRRRHAQARRLPARRDDELAPGEAPDRAHRAARARGAPDAEPRDLQILDVREQKRVGRRPHPGLGVHPVARHRRAARRARPGAADRGRVRLGPARGGGREPGAALRARAR